MNNLQFGTMLIFVAVIQIATTKMLKKIDKRNPDNKISIEYVWIVLPVVLTAFFIFSLFVYNNWFVGSVMPDKFIANRNKYFQLGVLAAVFGVYRLIIGIARYRKSLCADTMFEDEETRRVRLIIVSGVALLLTALLIYIVVEIIVPLIWRLKN
jgi:hypothetical protein